MADENNRYKKIKNLVETVIEPSIKYIKTTRKRKNMPYGDIENLVKIFYPKTKYEEINNGAFKHVYVIHSNKRKLVLKVGRAKRRINKDHKTYLHMPENVRNRYFAKIYWTHNIFMLQKYGKKANIPEPELTRLKNIGKKYNLKDVREANILKFGRRFKIVDAERRK